MKIKSLKQFAILLHEGKKVKAESLSKSLEKRTNLWLKRKEITLVDGHYQLSK